MNDTFADNVLKSREFTITITNLTSQGLDNGEINKYRDVIQNYFNLYFTQHNMVAEITNMDVVMNSLRFTATFMDSNEKRDYLFVIDVETNTYSSKRIG